MNLEFGKNLKRLRREKDMTQDELAQALTLSVQAISRYETGAAYPDIEMLPVIAGFFGTTVDDLLGVSSEVREKRMDDYTEQLRKITDRKERLELLRREHAEFPDCWNIVSDMVYEMTYLPDCLNEMRNIVNDAVKRCDEALWRENMILFYLESEPDEEKALEFIDKWSSKYDIRKTACLKHRYMCRNDAEKFRSVSQKILCDQLTTSFLALSERNGCSAEEGVKNCRCVLDFLDVLSSNTDRTKPDMWVTTKLLCMLRLSNNFFALSQNDDGFCTLETAVRLFENFFALPDGTVLTYGSPKLDCLIAKTKKCVYYGISEFTGMVAESMVTDLIYENPIGHINRNEKYIYDMEGFEGENVFSSHTYNFLKYAQWDGFANVKNDPRYISILDRAKAVSTLENLDNILFTVREQAARDDDWIKDKDWVSALLVPGIGAYVVFGNPGDLEEKIERMKREGNTNVCRVVTVKVGGDLIPPPSSVVSAVAELENSNIDAQVVMSDSDGNLVFSSIGELLHDA